MGEDLVRSALKDLQKTSQGTLVLKSVSRRMAVDIRGQYKQMLGGGED